MMLDALLAYAHISAILLLAVFITSKTALMRPEVIAVRESIVLRLLRLDRWLWFSFAAVLVTGALWMRWGAKGWIWTASNPLLWAKLALFVAMVGMSLPASRTLLAWQGALELNGCHPPSQAIRAQRRWLMLQAHLLALVPLLGVLLAHGY